MSVSTSALLDKVEAAISNLLDAMATPGVQEYHIGNRRVRRAEFAPTLNSLMKQRNQLRRQLARSSTSPVRVGKLGRARTTDR